ncbi:MAG TPA: PKD domain-containing protein, partial [Candidatus Gracilibacteria bacterium]|nr:PKD domain-containing protein [Candidatus Gracilibacteria bacterium]
MITKILLFLLAFFSFHFYEAEASGRMMARPNENVILTAESDLYLPNYKWTLMKDKEIVKTMASPVFSYVFSQEGVYQLNLVITSPNSKESENSSVEIVVGSSEQFVDSLNVNLETLPSYNDKKQILLNPNNLNLSFIAKDSAGQVKEYRIDTDIKQDSNNDGDPTNDIDNLDHISYQNGSLWTYTYQTKQLPTQARVTLIAENGETTQMELSVMVNSVSLRSQALKAVIQTYPVLGDDNRIHLKGDEAELLIFAGNSTGAIKEYRIDLDAKLDANGDGKTDNDIENKSDNSWKTGSVFKTKLKRAEGNKIIQLLVVGENGKGSVVKRQVVWDINTKASEFRLVVDKTELEAGEKAMFALDGFIPTEDWEIKWDFDADKKTDETLLNTNLASFVYNTPGTYEAMAQIKNEKKKILKYAKIKILVKEKPIPAVVNKIDFTIQQKDNLVKLTPSFSGDPKLKPADFKYLWRFGDGQTADKMEVEHLYTEAKEFPVRLSVKIDDKTELELEKKVIIAAVSLKEESLLEKLFDKKDEPQINPEEGGDQKEVEKPEIENSVKTPVNWSAIFLKITIWALIIFAALGGVLLVYLLFLKIKNPDYSFAEIIEEEKEKILSALEGQEYEPPHGEIVSAEKQVKESVEKVMDKEEKPEPKAPEKKEEKPAPVEEEKVPDWLKSTSASANTDTSKATAEENPSTSSEDNAPVPDWLKNEDNAVVPVPAENPLAEALPAEASSE